ncbi:MAG: 3-hydroxyacyl-CoA dehydrogenase NAD-binding domain-containing protein [Leptospiraceae bacterium]|nr:3-hydroxyacyl-CoA dehydrogenase NAD-binding domain-containing protein [Leptospiraceae bacterium]MDW8307331.1 3-hydroxyacyl-CoA dehydrogenase NAD-binding domain-containing protein [Leptospiraceae bacterium]
MKKVLVVGAGTMGAGIAYLFARSFPEAQVFLVDIKPDQLQKARESQESWEKKDRQRGNLAEGQKLNLIYEGSFTNLPKDFDLLLEAVSEDLELKKKIFRTFDELSHDTSLITSNTSSLSLTLMAREVPPQKRGNVLGLHFFNPPLVMPLLEIVQTLLTSSEALERAKSIAVTLKKTPVVVKDSPGFITTRLGMVMLNEAVFALQEGIASAEEIDQAMKLGFNHPMGPLELADLIGLDVVFAITQTLYENFQDSKYRAAPLLRKLVEAGHLGRKTGRGFYTYPRST